MDRTNLRIFRWCGTCSCGNFTDHISWFLIILNYIHIPLDIPWNSLWNPIFTPSTQLWTYKHSTGDPLLSSTFMVFMLTTRLTSFALRSLGRGGGSVVCSVLSPDSFAPVLLGLFMVSMLSTLATRKFMKADIKASWACADGGDARCMQAQRWWRCEARKRGWVKEKVKM